MRIPVVPGTDPRQSYGDLSGEHDRWGSADWQVVILHLVLRTDE